MKKTPATKWEVHIEAYHRDDGFDSLVYYSDAKTTNAAILEAEGMANNDGYVVNRRLTEAINVSGEAAARDEEINPQLSKPKLSFDSRLILIKSLVEETVKELRAKECELVDRQEEALAAMKSVEYALTSTRMQMNELRAACATLGEAD